MELTRRDKKVVAAGGIFLLLFMVVQFICLPAMDRLDRQKRILAAQDEAIARMRQLARDYQDLSLRLDKQKRMLGQRPSNFTLFSFLDTQAQQSGVKRHVAFMKPVTQDTDNKAYKLSKVRVKLKEVYFKGLVDFLSRIESPRNGVGISSLSLNKAGRKGTSIDAVIEAQTLMISEVAAK